MRIRSKQIDQLARAAQALAEMDEDVAEVHVMFANRDKDVRAQITVTRCLSHGHHVDVHMSTTWNREEANERLEVPPGPPGV